MVLEFLFGILKNQILILDFGKMENVMVLELKLMILIVKLVFGKMEEELIGLKFWNWIII